MKRLGIESVRRGKVARTSISQMKAPYTWDRLNRLQKTEAIHRCSWPNREQLELATLEWVSWFNHQRLLDPVRFILPEKAKANYYR